MPERPAALRAPARLKRGGRLGAGEGGAVSGDAWHARDPKAEALAISAITALAAALRFATLDAQGFWFDESVTVGLVEHGFADMLRAIPRSESTPPLYYAVAWLWKQLFGAGEVGLRSLSALCGTAAVPVAWAAARELATSRVAIWVAALAAVNPFLVWYSQEARAYALLLLLGGLSLWLCARLLRAPRGRDAALWALVSALALSTHYFALFPVAAEALWLLARLPRRMAVPAIAGVGLAAAALLPLALRQEGAGYAAFIADEPLGRRSAQAIKQLVLGFDSPIEPLTAGLALAIAGAGLLLAAARAGPPLRRGLRVAGSIAVAAALLPIALALLGTDYVLTRNLILAWVPFTVVVCAGLTSAAAGRAGRAALGVAAALALVSTVGVPLSPAWQREDWRGAAAAIGPPAARAILVSEPSQARPLLLYRRRARPVTLGAYPVTEIVAISRRGRNLGERLPTPPDPVALQVLGLRAVERRDEPTYSLVRMVPVAGTATYPPLHIAGLRLARERGPAAVLVEPAAGSPADAGGG